MMLTNQALGMLRDGVHWRSVAHFLWIHTLLEAHLTPAEWHEARGVKP